MSEQGDHLEVVEPETLERMAYILGPNSAARRALEDYTKRREQGEDVVILHARAPAMLLVGPS